MTKSAIFPENTWFTGVDRQIYPRSLYKYIRYDEKTNVHHVEHWALAGDKTEPPAKMKWKWLDFHNSGQLWLPKGYDVVARGDLWYREATAEEVKAYLKHSYVETPEFYGYEGKFYAKSKRSS